MVAAIIVCGLGYAEGARLSRNAGRLAGHLLGARALPAGDASAAPYCESPATVKPSAGRAWTALAYVSLFSMLIGFFFWYRGLVQGGIAAVGQFQLLQPFLRWRWRLCSWTNRSGGGLGRGCRGGRLRGRRQALRLSTDWLPPPAALGEQHVLFKEKSSRLHDTLANNVAGARLTLPGRAVAL